MRSSVKGCRSISAIIASLWNLFLAKRREDYQRDKTGSNYYKDAAALTKLKHRPEYDWLYEASTASEQRTLKNLDDAYKRFFKGKARFPRFKSKRHDQSFTLAGDISIRGNRICFPKFSEGLRFARTVPDHTKINNVTVKITSDGVYYVLPVGGGRGGSQTSHWRRSRHRPGTD